jgi:hypothetical protein
MEETALGIPKQERGHRSESARQRFFLLERAPVVARGYTKCVLSGPDARVVRRAPVLGSDPVPVEPVQTIPEAQQVWVQQANGTLFNPQSGRCLDDPSGYTANGTRLQLWDCNGAGAQDFVLH